MPFPTALLRRFRNMKYIVVYGGAADWHKSLGPFASYEEALAEAEQIRHSSWWISPVRDGAEESEQKL
jgi:hypothetical protein